MNPWWLLLIIPGTIAVTCTVIFFVSAWYLTKGGWWG